MPQNLRMTMDWSPESATNAYLDTLKLCNKQKGDTNSTEAKEPETNEFISALAAGMNSQLIIEVASDVSTSTVALAAAAKQTGGKLVCILPEQNLDKSQKILEESGLDNMVEFRTGDPVELLPDYENIDFSLVDCKSEDYPRLLNMLDVNPKRSVVVTNNLVEGRDGVGAGANAVKGIESKLEKNKVNVRSMKHPIGKGMEVTMIGKTEHGKRERLKSSSRSSRGGERKGNMVKRGDKSKWVFKIDEKSGEEHIYRVPKFQSQ